MMSTSARYLALLAAVLFRMRRPDAVEAHKLNIFAWPADKESIQGEAVFSGGRKAKHIKISVENAATHTVLLETVSNEQGAFHFTVPALVVQQRLDLLIAGDAGEGHRGEWLLKAEEYLDAKERGALPEQKKENAAKNVTVDEQLIRRIAAEEIERKLVPVRQILAKSSERSPELRDVLGGIGCILGVAGFFAWLHTRRPKKSEQVQSD